MTDAKRELFRRLRRATSRIPLAPGPVRHEARDTVSSRGPGESSWPHGSLRVDEIVEPVWVLELEEG